MSTYPPPPPIPPPPPPPAFYPPPAVRPPNWFQRNWKWFVPVTLVSVIVLFVAVIAVAVFAGLRAMKSSEAYQLSLTSAQKSPLAIEQLGQPIEDELFFSGNINVTNGSGEANLSIPVRGPKGEAVVISSATKGSGPWSLESLVLQLPDGRAVDLLSGPAPEP